MVPGKDGIAGIPINTYQAARQVYNPSNIYLLIGDQTEKILGEIDLRLLDPYSSQDEEMIYRLALITAFQYDEGVSDEVASDASRKRVDWKYALHLPVLYQGVPVQALSDFRMSLFASPRALRAYGHLLAILRRMGLFQQKEECMIDPVMVLRTVCQISRLYRLYYGIKAALSMIGSMDPDWLRQHMSSHWFSHYKTGELGLAVGNDPESMTRQALRIGKDIQFLLKALREQKLIRLIYQPEIQTISRLMEEQFVISGEQIQWKIPG